MPNHSGAENTKSNSTSLAALAAIAISFVLCAGLIYAQSQSPATQARSAATAQPTFEAASIKPAKPEGAYAHVSTVRTQPGGRFTALNATLRSLIGAAYELKPGERVVGLPSWADSEQFDVETKADGNPTEAQVHAMERALLAERFKLIAHREVQQQPEYALVLVKVGKTGPQLRPHSESDECVAYNPSSPLPPTPPDPEATPPPAPPCGSFIGGRTRLAGDKVTMEQLATALGNIRAFDRPLVDHTGLSGVFDLTLRYTPQMDTQPGADGNAPEASQFPPIITALQEQPGLKLEPTVGPVGTLVIDHVEHLSPN